MPELTVLFVGDATRAEFRDARASLDALARVVTAESLEDAAARVATGESLPDVIVVAQAYPGQYSAQGIDRLRRLVPLAPLLGLLGAWCEGETRTGKPWPAAIRVYWHQWPARARQELGWLREGIGASWALPITASEEERILAVSEQPFGPGQGRIGIVSPQFEMQDWLAAACRRRGFTTVWIGEPFASQAPAVAAAIFDATDGCGAESERLRRLVGAVRPARVIALMDFPRAEDRDRLLDAGATAVLSKPFLIEDLYETLDHASQEHPA